MSGNCRSQFMAYYLSKVKSFRSREVDGMYADLLEARPINVIGFVHAYIHYIIMLVFVDSVLQSIFIKDC